MAINGIKTDEWSEITKTTQANSNNNISISFERNGHVYQVNVIPETTQDGQGIIGIAPTRYQVGIVESIFLSIKTTKEVMSSIITSLVNLVINYSSANLSSIIGIAKMADEAARTGFIQLISLTALLSISIGIFNLSPIPVMDGGHIFLLFIQSLRGRPLSDKFLNYSQYVGIGFIAALFIFSIYCDFGNMGWIH